MFGAGIMYVLLFISLYFEIFMLVSFLERRRFAPALATSAFDAARAPSVAIVVPCYNEERTIISTLQSLAALDYPAKKLEIIAVDDGSSDRTREMAESFAAGSAANIRVLHKRNGGKHSAMNVGLAHTGADYIGCLDADSSVARDALAHIVPLFADPSIAAVTPGIHVRAPRTAIQHLQYVEYRISIFNRFILAGLGGLFITPGPFSIFRASVIRELGGWRPGHSTEDMEMALRIQQAGHLIANAPRAVVHTAAPATFRGLFRQRVRWTYGWLRNAVDYRSMVGNRRFGNLGIIILPSALISIATGIYFFIRVLWLGAHSFSQEVMRIEVAGVQVPHASFNAFYLPTSMLWLLVWTSIAVVLLLISVGSHIGTGSRRPPAATPLFLLLYSFIVPLWLITAVVRATFKTGVRWR